MLRKIKTLIMWTFGIVPSDFERAMELFSKGKYDIAEKKFRVVYQRQLDQQFDLGKRIHLGASLHMIGLCSLFQCKLEEAFKHFILAYISDTVNVALRHEDEADSAPAYQVLREIFRVSNITFESIKEIAKSRTNTTEPIDVMIFFKNFMQKANAKTPLELINNRKLIDNYSKYTTIQLIRLFFATPGGKKALDEAVQTFEAIVLQKVAEIVEKEGYRGEIREENIERVVGSNLNIDADDFMSGEAKILLDRAKSKIWECIALKTLVRVLEQDRGKIDENDVREILKFSLTRYLRACKTA